MCEIKDDSKVDIVLLWVDGNDPEWLKEKNKYLHVYEKSYLASVSDSRFRSWDNLQYIFRGIERFMPWVNKVFFVTWGHIPKWLDTSCEKLRIVRHDEFIPSEYLPTFNSNVIELNLHRIKDLSDHFISFNDDTFVIGPTQKSDFFLNGIPRSEGILSPYPIRKNGISCSEARNLEVLNTHFSKKDIKKHLGKWINPVYGMKSLRTILFLQFSWIVGIYEPHAPLSLLKKTLAILWKEEETVLSETSKNRFRGKNDVNIWLVRQWQMLQGFFIPRSPLFNKLVVMPRDCDLAIKVLKKKGKCRLLCINDANTSEQLQEFEEYKKIINEALNSLLPEQSAFERY